MIGLMFCVGGVCVTCLVNDRVEVCIGNVCRTNSVNDRVDFSCWWCVQDLFGE